MSITERPESYGPRGPSLKHGLIKEIPPFSRRAFVKLAGLLGLGTAGAPMAGERALLKGLAAGALEYRNFQPDRMSYRRLGKTNLMVSAVALGGASNYGNGGPGATSNPAAYQAMMKKLLDLGVNYFDSSPFKGSAGYDTEDKFAFLSGQNRDKVFLSTKVDSVVPAELKQSVEESLTFMKTDHLDILYIHNSIGVTEAGDYSGALAALEAMENLRTQGKVRFLGFSSHVTSILTGLLNQYADRLDVIMSFYTPTDKWAWAADPLSLWKPVYQLAKDKDIGVVAMKVLMSGQDAWTDRASALRKDSAAMARLQPFLDQGSTLPQACIRWALSNDAIHSCVLGMRTLAEAEEDAAAPGPMPTGLFGRLQAGPLELKTSPNPMSEFATICFPYPETGKDVRLAIYESSGREIRNFNAALRDGKRIVHWDGRGENGEKVRPGTYFMVGKAGSRVFTETLVVIR